MYEIKDIISKVREMYRFDTTVKDIIKNPTSTRISEKDGELQIEAIIFDPDSWGNNVTVVPDCIRYYDRNKNEWKTLIKYKDFKELLNL